MEWITFVNMVVSNPWLLLSWEFLSSALAALLVFWLTGRKLDVRDLRGRLGQAVLGSDKDRRSLREKLAERIAGQPLEKEIHFPAREAHDHE